MAYGDVAECYGNAVFSTNGPSRSALVPYARIPGNRVKQPKPRSPESAMLGHEFPPDGFDLLFELPPRSFDFAFELAPHCAPRRSVRNATINETINGVFWTVRPIQWQLQTVVPRPAAFHNSGPGLVRHVRAGRVMTGTTPSKKQRPDAGGVGRCELPRPTPCGRVPPRFAKRPLLQFRRLGAAPYRRRRNADRSGFRTNSAFGPKLAGATPWFPRRREPLQHKWKQRQRSCCAYNQRAPTANRNPPLGRCLGAPRFSREGHW
jgi:hypothetical protein